MNNRTHNIISILEGLNESADKMTKEKFLDYVRIQMSGVTNMFDVRRVCSLSKEGLTKDDCLDIMKNYDKYRKQWCKNIKESAGNIVGDNIDRSKYGKLLSEIEKSGYTFDSFEVTKIGNDLFTNIKISKQRQNDSLVPSIHFALGDRFCVRIPSNGELSTKEARKLANNIVSASALVDKLNKIDFEDYIV